MPDDSIPLGRVSFGPDNFRSEDRRLTDTLAEGFRALSSPILEVAPDRDPAPSIEEIRLQCIVTAVEKTNVERDEWKDTIRLADLMVAYVLKES